MMKVAVGALLGVHHPLALWGVEGGGRVLDCWLRERRREISAGERCASSVCIDTAQCWDQLSASFATLRWANSCVELLCRTVVVVWSVTAPTPPTCVVLNVEF